MAGFRTVKGLVALITGGTAGFGEATARRLVKQGAAVVLCDLPSSSGEQVAKSLGENCVFSPADITNENEVQNTLRTVAAKFEKLNVLVNCADVGIASKKYDFTKNQPPSLEDVIKILNASTIASFNVIRLAARLISKNQPDEDGLRGVIINTSSANALEGQRGQLAEATSAGGIVGMTLPLARDFENFGIRCCTIAPGLFNTPSVQSLSEEEREQLVNNLPFSKRIWETEQYAQLVQCIIENSFLNGCVIRIGAPLRM